jgi:hypothetical protein
LFFRSEDGTIRFYSSFTGQNLNMNMEEMDCDFLTAQGNHLLTRVRDESEDVTMLVWLLKPTPGEERDLVAEVDIDKELALKATSFQMKVGAAVNPENELG